MTTPVVFIDALPPDASNSVRDSHRSSIRRAAAHHVHNARRQRQIVLEEKKQAIAGQARGRLRKLKPKPESDHAVVQSASYSKQPASGITHVSPHEKAIPTDQASTHKYYRVGELGERDSLAIWHTSGQTTSLLSAPRLGPSLFFCRWTADREKRSSKLGLNTISSTLEAIDCFVTAVLPNNTPLYGIFEVSNHLALPIIDELITDHAFREIWSSSMQNCRSVLAPSSKSPQSALMHKLEGMAMLRHGMQDSAFESNDYKLAAIACLAYMSSWDGDVAAADIHFTYLLRAIKTRGGLDALGFDGWLRSTILQLDSLLALETGVSRFQEYRLLRISHDPWIVRRYDSLPIGFRKLARQGALSPDTVEVLLRINRLESQMDHSVLNPDVGRWRSRRYEDFYGAFSCFLVPGVSLEKLLCATLILYSVNQYSPQSHARDIITAFVVPRRYVKEHICEQLSSDKTEEECLTWIFAVLIDSYATLEPGLLQQWDSQLPGWRHVLHQTIAKFFCSPKFAASCQSMLELPLQQSDSSRA